GCPAPHVRRADPDRHPARLPRHLPESLAYNAGAPAARHLRLTILTAALLEKGQRGLRLPAMAGHSKPPKLDAAFRLPRLQRHCPYKPCPEICPRLGKSNPT